MCLLSSCFSLGIYLQPLHEEARDLGSDLATGDWNEDRIITPFLLHHIKALQGKTLSHSMKIPGNGANSNATVIPTIA